MRQQNWRSVGLLVGMVFLSFASSSHAEMFTDGLYATAGTWSRGMQPNSIIRMNHDGSWETAFSLPSGASNSPFGLGFLDRERLAVTLGWGEDILNGFVGRLSSFDSEGNILTTVNGIPATNRYVNGSWGWGFAIDADRTIYVATWNTPGATKVTSGGNVSDWTGYQHELWWGQDAVLSPYNGGLYITKCLDAANSKQLGSIYRINKQNGARTTILEDIDWVAGIEFNADGDMFFSQRRENEIWRLDAGTTEPYPFADVPSPRHMTKGFGDLLYVIGVDDADGDFQVWQVDPVTGNSTLFADNLPVLGDLAFVPEPSSLTLLCSLAPLLCCLLSRRSRRVLR